MISEKEYKELINKAFEAIESQKSYINLLERKVKSCEKLISLQEQLIDSLKKG